MQSEGLHNEKVLLGLIADGDETAFRKLFHTYMPLLHPLILKVVKEDEAAEDILQETFLRIWVYRDKLPEVQNPKAWVFKIAYNQAFTYLKKKVVQQKTSKKFEATNHVDLSKNNSEELLAFKNLSFQVKTAINKLPSQQKKVYQLSRDHGLKIEEIATEMSLSQQTVKNTLGRALKFIREQIKESGILLVLLSLLR